jgi:signal transduction histidine kinase
MGRQRATPKGRRGFGGEAPTRKVFGTFLSLPSHATDQDSFIDMTSHELRNPLSAIVQCSESAITTLQHITTKQLPSTPTAVDSSVLHEDVSSCMDALQTIVSCSTHAKRIIDDVLTLSKLDSNLILITPILVQPTAVVYDAIKMFMLECQQTGITLEFKKDGSIKEFGWVMLDPSRLLQILINLLYAFLHVSLSMTISDCSKYKRHQVHQRSISKENHGRAGWILGASVP